jgi:hypothetical protein
MGGSRTNSIVRKIRRKTVLIDILIDTHAVVVSTTRSYMLHFYNSLFPSPEI